MAQRMIRVGRRIGSAALIADGLHARTDGFTSLAVVFGALGVLAGFPLADPVVGLLITAAILVVLRGAARDIYRRLMDAVDPDLFDTPLRRPCAACPASPMSRSCGCAGSGTGSAPRPASSSTPT